MLDILKEYKFACSQWPGCVWFYWICIYFWRLVLVMSLSLWVVMACTLLHCPVSWWLDMDSKNCWTDVGSFLPMMKIQTLVLFLSGNAWFNGLLFSDWVMYDILWCSQYCAIITMGVTLGGKLTVPSNISYLIKGWSDRSVFNVGRVEICMPNIRSDPGDHPLPNLLLYS